MGNKRIGITGEMAAFIRAKRGDKLSEAFVTSRVKFLYWLVGIFVSKKKIDEVFEKRVALSDLFYKTVSGFDAEQVIELASGSSVLGLKWCGKNKGVYVESDFEKVVSKKREIIGGTLENHKFVVIDVLEGDIYSRVKSFVRKRKRTLVVAEGLTTYLDQEDFDKLIDNVSKFLGKMGGGAFLAHEGGSVSKTGLRRFVSLITGSKSYGHFENRGEVEKYFKSRGFRKIKFVGSEPIVYLVGK